MSTFRIGSATPLFFPNEWREYDSENELDYVQKFAPTDTILLQLISDSSTAPTVYIGSCTDAAREFLEPTTTETSTYAINGTTYCHTLSLSGLEDGIYYIVAGGYRSAPFEVTSNEIELENTKLIRYTHSSNNNPLGNIFTANGSKVYFEFRVECGFKSSGIQPKIEAENFRDQFQRTSYLYSYPYLVETLTFGTASGLPAIFCDFINKIFSLDEVYVDGTRVVRSDSALPQAQQLIENAQKYVFTLDVEVQKDDELTDITSEVIAAITDENGQYITDESGNMLYTEI